MKRCTSTNLLVVILPKKKITLWTIRLKITLVNNLAFIIKVKIRRNCVELIPYYVCIPNFKQSMVDGNSNDKDVVVILWLNV